ncbi:MAG: NUDIX domain-containing protein [Chitinophagaceae bacterium]|nr:NUDIX domain-containing protein [Chitinophagaceae bacterium]
MMKQSAGILLYRMRSKLIEVLLAHPGGPFWKNRDNGAWSIPKGEFSNDEEPLKAALREFEEETGVSIEGKMIELTPVKQKSGKLVLAWAVEGSPDITRFTSNNFSVEWPLKSGRMAEFPEIDKWEWFDMAMARKKILERQIGLLDELMTILNG